MIEIEVSPEQSGALAYCRGGIPDYNPLAFMKGLGMENRPQPPQQLPVVPLNAPTLGANIVLVQYMPGNGAIQVQLAEEREAPVERIGDKVRNAVFEIGRFALTPRALRMLLDTANASAKAFAEATGKPLPTIDQFNAQGAMTGLLSPQPPKPPE